MTRRATTKDARKKPRRHTRGTYETISELRDLAATPENEGHVARLGDALALWVRFMVETNPAAASTIYKAVCDEWKSNRARFEGDVKAEWYDKADRATVMFHSAVLEALREARGEPPSVLDKQEWREREAQRRIMLDAAEGIARRLAGEEADAEAQA